MVSSTKIQLCIDHLPKSTPEVTEEASVSIGDDGCGQPMEAIDFVKVELGDSYGIGRLPSRDEMDNLEIRSTTTKMESLPRCVLGRLRTKSILISLHDCVGTGNGMYMPTLVVAPFEI